MFKCVQCEKILNNMAIVYWFEEKWYIKGSTYQLPLCSCKCGVEYYEKNGYNKKDVLKNVKGSN